VLQTPGALNGDVEDAGESHVSVRVATRHVNPTEEALPRGGVEGRLGATLQGMDSGGSQRGKRMGGKRSLFGVRLDKTPRVGGSLPNPVYRTPGERITRDREHEASVRMQRAKLQGFA
jgi:hypothetical protein